MKTLLDIFNESEKEVYEITQEEWINIHKNHMLNWINETNKMLNENEKITDIENRLYTDKIESKCFHKSAVERALKDGIEVSEIVLKDYEGLKEKIEEEQRKAIEIENSRVLLTYDMIKDLKENTKLIIDGYKVTLKEIKDDYIICKPYKLKNKIWKVSLNCKISKFVIGWK